MPRTTRRRNAVYKQLCTAIQADNAEQIEALLEMKKNALDPVDMDDLLCRAVNRSHLASARCLLELGANPNEAGDFSAPKCQRDHLVEMLQLLVEFGLDLKQKGRSILLEVIDHRDALDWLLDQGVDPNGIQRVTSPWAETPANPQTRP